MKYFKLFFIRRKLVFQSFIDIILLIFILNLYDSINFFNLIKMIFLWTIISYIVGKYHHQGNKLLDIFNLLIKTVIAAIFFINITLLLSIPFYKLTLNYIYLNYFDRNILIFFCLSFLIQSILISIIFTNENVLRKWIIINSDLMDKLNLIESKYDLFENHTFKFLGELDFIDPSFFDGVIIDSRKKTNDVKEKILNLKKKGFKIYQIIEWSDIFLQKIPLNLFSYDYIVNNILFHRQGGVNYRVKRIGEYLLTMFLIVITFPLLVVAAILIYINDRGPIFYTQARTGLNCKIIKITKLRTMNVNAEKDGVMWSKKNDSRVTKIGKIIRKYRIDELPQLFSIIKGDMSLIGPRPERPEFDELLSKDIPFYYNRYDILPGISGWAQVNYPYGASINDSRIKLSYDIYYLRNYGIMIDFLILFKTIKLVFNGLGSNSKK